MDAALGAEGMVETLTDKNLELEERVEDLQTTVTDLVSYYCSNASQIHILGHNIDIFFHITKLLQSEMLLKMLYTIKSCCMLLTNSFYCH